MRRASAPHTPGPAIMGPVTRGGGTDRKAASVNGWVTSSYCDAGACVEVAGGGGAVVRDKADPGGPVLAFTPAAWQAFTAALKGLT